MRFLFLALFSTVILLSCKKDEDQAAKDDKIIQEYLTKNSLTATKTASGLYYIINTEGTGSSPILSSDIKVYYKGYLTDGTVFDETTGDYRIFTLNELITGWQEGLQLIKEGGKITLFVPSKLGYGSNSAGKIPANSVLIFEIELLDII